MEIWHARLEFMADLTCRDVFANGEIGSDDCQFTRAGYLRRTVRCSVICVLFAPVQRFEWLNSISSCVLNQRIGVAGSAMAGPADGARE
jgi:hypothetical protein